MTNEPEIEAEISCGDEPEIRAAVALLPAWFVPRMMGDQWSFGLVLVSGFVLAINHIKAVRQAANGSIWLDVEMLETVPPWAENLPMKTVVAPTERLTASVNAAHIVCAFELADT